MEDSLLDAEIVQDRLQSEGLDCEIRLAATRSDFEAALDEGIWDLIICDYNVPGYSGAEALQLSRDTYPRVPVIMLSSSLSEEEAVKCLHMGAADYLVKQSLTRLPSAVERALDQAKARKLQYQAEQKFRSLLEHAPDAMVIVDAHGKIALVNFQAERLFGYDRSELLGQSIAILIPERYRHRHGAHVTDFFTTPVAKIMGSGTELFGLKRDGSEFPFEVSLSPLETPEGLLTNAVVHDLTERRRLETQLMRVRRIESIGSFAGRIAHDLNNALAPVLMSIELLRHQYPDSTELVDAIESGANRGADMLRQLLVFSQGSYVEPKRVETIQLLRDVERYVARILLPQIRFVLEIDENLKPIWGDATQLHQVLMNLCVNARDAIQGDGVLTVRAENIELDRDAAATIPGVMPGTYLLFQISDTGKGMSADILDKIFEPFFTTKSHGKGTGLGLSIVAGIVKSHGGFVEVASKLAVGTTFKVYIPADQQPLVESGSSESVLSNSVGKGEWILVVDDSREVRHVAKLVLESLNYRVLMASDGNEALDVLQSIDERIDLVLTDLDMPHMNGYDLVRQLTLRYPKIGIIVTSGVLGEDKVQSLKELGVQAFIAKPFTQKGLFAVLAQTLYPDAGT